jgi:DNA (cytosine-5)-methyltransferase 1
MVLDERNRAFVKKHGANTADDHETWEEADTARTLNAMGQAGTNGALVAPVAFSTEQTPKGWDVEEGTSPTVKGTSPTGGGQPMAAMTVTGAVRRLTPTECERLQAFPDGWTAIPK